METTARGKNKTKRSKLHRNEPTKKPSSYLYDSRNMGLPVFGVIVQWDTSKTYSNGALTTLFESKLSSRQLDEKVTTSANKPKKSALRRKRMPFFRRSGPNKGMITFETMEEANHFSLTEDPDFYYFIPLSFVVVVGVAVMSASNFNFLNLKSARNSHEILQWRKQKLPDKKIRITVAIRGSILPSKLTIGETEIPLEPYERKPVYCSRCLRYGHRKSNCLHKPRCGICIGTKPALKHFETKCLSRNKNNPICFYCRENHASGSRECFEYTQQCEYKSQLTRYNMDYVSVLEAEIIPAIQTTSINSSRIWLDT